MPRSRRRRSPECSSQQSELHINGHDLAYPTPVICLATLRPDSEESEIHLDMQQCCSNATLVGYWRKSAGVLASTMPRPKCKNCPPKHALAAYRNEDSILSRLFRTQHNSSCNSKRRSCKDRPRSHRPFSYCSTLVATVAQPHPERASTRSASWKHFWSSACTIGLRGTCSNQHHRCNCCVALARPAVKTVITLPSVTFLPSIVSSLLTYRDVSTVVFVR